MAFKLYNLEHTIYDDNIENTKQVQEILQRGIELRFHSPVSVPIPSKEKSIFSSIYSFFSSNNEDNVKINFNEFRPLQKKPISPQGYIYDSILTYDPLSKSLLLLFYVKDEENVKHQISEVNFIYFLFLLTYLMLLLFSFLVN